MSQSVQFWNYHERLVALGQAHNLLSDRAWRWVALRTVAEQNLKAFDQPGRPRIHRGRGGDGAAGTGIDLGLCLHELATNATKYGALSVDQDRVDVTWTLNPRGPVTTLELSGPSVAGRAFPHRNEPASAAGS